MVVVEVVEMVEVVLVATLEQMELLTLEVAVVVVTRMVLLIMVVMVDPELLSSVIKHKNHSINRPQDPLRPSGGSYSRCIQHTGGMTATHKLIFVASFFWFMNWGVRVTSVVLDKF